jgi:hypothetical protein
MALWDAVRRFAVVYVGEQESWDDFGGKKESNMNPILEGKCKEGMWLNLKRRKAISIGLFL